MTPPREDQHAFGRGQGYNLRHHIDGQAQDGLHGPWVLGGLPVHQPTPLQDDPQGILMGDNARGGKGGEFTQAVASREGR